MEKRGGALIDNDKTGLERRMRAYYDHSVDWDLLKTISPKLTCNAGRFDAKKARKKIQDSEVFSGTRLVRYALRPFDNRWTYYSPVRPLWNEPRPHLWQQYCGGNNFLMSRPAGVAHPEGVSFFLTRNLGDNDFLRGHAYYIPFEEKPMPRRTKRREATQHKLPLETQSSTHHPRPNLSGGIHLYALELDIPWEPGLADGIWMHSLAVGYSSKYLQENVDGIRQDWPRIPLPDSKEALAASAALGRQIAALLDTEVPVKTVTTGEIRSDLKLIATPSRFGGGSLKESELALTVGWGHAGKGGVTMPGKGKLLERDYSPSERKAILEGARCLNLSEKQLFSLLGEKTLDVFLNDVAFWCNIPEKVWHYTIGGYQVIKKWLSYREEPILGRPLTKDEVRYVQEMARRIAALILLQPALDANYESVKQHTFLWPPETK